MIQLFGGNETGVIMSQPTPDPIPSPTTGPLVSTLASDPDMAELVQFFVEEIGERIETIQTTAQTNDIAGLRTVAHQLKGAATGYGFEPISQTASELERLIDVTEPPTVTQDILQQVDDLIALCKRASA